MAGPPGPDLLLDPPELKLKYLLWVVLVVQWELLVGWIGLRIKRNEGSKKERLGLSPVKDILILLKMCVLEDCPC